MKHFDKVYCAHVPRATFPHLQEGARQVYQAGAGQGLLLGSSGVPGRAVPGRVGLAGAALPSHPPVCACVCRAFSRGAAGLPARSRLRELFKHAGSRGPSVSRVGSQGSGGPGLPSPAGMGGCRGNRSAGL